MSTLLIVVGALFLAVIGLGILDPWPPADPDPAERAEDSARMMEAIARAFF